MSTMTDADIHAFRATAATSDVRWASVAGTASAGAGDAPLHRQAAPAGGRRVWPWALLALAVLFVAGVVGGVMLLGTTLDQALGGLDVRIDGERIVTVPRGEAAWWAVAAGVLAGMVMLVVVPLSLLLALLITALLLAAAVVAVLAVGALALSPLWVLALVLWLSLRRPRTHGA